MARLLEEHGEEILSVYALPEAHRKRMRTTNLLERQNQELKRRTRVVRVFPNEASCLQLVSALLMETNQEWMERLYLRMDTAPPTVAETTAAAAAGSPPRSVQRPTRVGDQQPETLRSNNLQKNLDLTP